MKIIIGLGNPGKEYENTKHNAGFMLVDKLAEEARASWRENKKFKALIAEASDTMFVKPQTFMNNSGQSVGAILSYYKLLPKTRRQNPSAWSGGDSAETENSAETADLSEILTVIHDDVDIAFGEYKISIDSRAAGHNGVQSIINHLKTKNFKRLRLGIKKSVGQEMIPTDKYVLMKFSKEEILTLNDLFKKIEIIL